LTGRRVGRVYVDRGYRGHRLDRAGLTVIVSHTRGLDFPGELADESNDLTPALRRLLAMPNENGIMDLQYARALCAAMGGAALCLRREQDRYRVDETSRSIANEAVRQRTTENCVRLRSANGASHIAKFIRDAAVTLRADNDPGRRLGD
jgi:hypothetical protein